MPPKAIICDIEGTTSSISFVHKVLFPLSLERIDEYLRHHSMDAEVSAQLDILWRNMGDSAASAAEKTSKIAARLKEFIRSDVKDTTLKWVQGKIWKEAFEAGSVKGHVYSDVPPAFGRWKTKGCSLFIYSSGSVEAQQLMFRYSEAGDLGRHLSGYFDTVTGMKRDAESYRKIAGATGFSSADMLFLSDIVQELQAAEAAGMQTCLLLREDAAIPEGYTGHSAHDFDQVEKIFFVK